MSEISRMIDLKHGITKDGRLVKVLSDGGLDEVPLTEPTILFRGRDRLALPMLDHYRHLCAVDGATDHQLTSVDMMIAKFTAHQRNNPVKQPGITRGAKWDGAPS